MCNELLSDYNYWNCFNNVDGFDFLHLFIYIFLSVTYQSHLFFRLGFFFTLALFSKRAVNFMLAHMKEAIHYKQALTHLPFTMWFMGVACASLGGHAQFSASLIGRVPWGPG